MCFEQKMSGEVTGSFNQTARGVGDQRETQPSQRTTLNTLCAARVGKMKQIYNHVRSFCNKPFTHDCLC